MMNFQGINVTKDGNNYKIDGKPTNPSSLIAYLGYRGTRMMEGQKGEGTAFSFNAIPWLAYWDIFKNYFANKQEQNYYWVTTGQTVREFTITATDGKHDFVINETIRIVISETVTIQANGSSTNWVEFWENTLLTLEGTSNGIKQVYVKELATTLDTPTVTPDKLQSVTEGTNAILTKIQNPNQNGVKLEAGPLEGLEKIRDTILQTPGNQAVIVNSIDGLNIAGKLEEDSKTPQGGLAVKTYDSDVFQNWVNTDWIDGPTGINEITAVDVSDGKLTMDSLNLAQT